MFRFMCFIIKMLFSIFPKEKRDLVIQYMILKKENEILKRNQKKIKFKLSDRLIYTIFHKLSKKIREHITLIKPETILKWQRILIKKFWTYNSEKSKGGRPSVPAEIKNLILDMKNKNLYWGYKRIHGELVKLGIKLDKKTIGNILRDFKRKGKVRKGLTWSKFLKSQIKSIYAMDFFTVDTIFNQRFYVFS